MNWQTERKVRYSELTQIQIDEICNGCGGKGGLIKPPHRIFFKTSCNHHDYKYATGCTTEDRKRADKKLYQAMVADCRDLAWLQWFRYRPWCWIYYLAVRAIGGNFFRYGDCQRWPSG